MSVKFKFDLEKFRNSLKAAFENLGDGEIRSAMEKGVEEAFRGRVEDLIRYEFTKVIQDKLFSERESLFSDSSFSPEVTTEMVTATIAAISRQYAQEVVNRSIR